MRRLRVRFTVRRLMVLVAVVGLSIGGWKEYQRCMRLREDHKIWADTFEHLARFARGLGSRTQEQWEADCREVERLNREPPYRYIDYWSPRPEPPELARRQADYYSRMQAKYERAARFPWWPVAPDPPIPR